jgi:outer membrane protein assembly factor BamE (lipoprotein component of BamABCDE complex)
MRYSVAYVALSLILVACGAGTPFSWEDTAKVKPGMTEAEVIAIMGKPYSRSASGTQSTLIWNYASHDGSKAVALKFENGRLVGNDKTGK